MRPARACREGLREAQSGAGEDLVHGHVFKFDSQVRCHQHSGGSDTEIRLIYVKLTLYLDSLSRGGKIRMAVPILLGLAGA